MSMLSCAQVRDLAPELALGVLGGAHRAEVLLHIDASAILRAHFPPFIIPLKNRSSQADAGQLQGGEIRHDFFPETSIVRGLGRLVLGRRSLGA